MKHVLIVLMALFLMACKEEGKTEVQVVTVDDTVCKSKAIFAGQVADYQMQNQLSKPYTREAINLMVNRGRVTLEKGRDMVKIQDAVDFGWTPVEANQKIYDLCLAGKI